jgi:hypothetical protein
MLLACAALVLFLPTLVATAVLIRALLGSPIIISQTRSFGTGLFLLPVSHRASPGGNGSEHHSYAYAVLVAA